MERVYEADLERWALTQAMFANVNFREHDSSGRPIGEPYTADDFLGRGNRQARAVKSAKERAEVQLVNARLARMKPGEPASDDLPAWAIGEYKGAN